MNLIWIAPPAAGKGTYCSMFKDKYGFNHISAGDVLREEVKNESEIGKEIASIMAKGEMIDDHLMKKLIEKKLTTLDLSTPFMLDGYPRKLNQAEDYEEILGKLGLNVDKVIFINISKETGLKRVLGRRTCPNCKRGYNILTGLNPKIDGICDNCGSTLESRSDDTEESYSTRYDVYTNETKAVIEKYRSEGKLIEINGEGAPEEIFKELEKLLGVNNG